ncbi:MAG: pantoate--beta-alanine ligase [Flavobacteriaceae bacterium]|nr:pantoate--beta-alanine ligase [Flavobacteriaceae bacterium]|tara:strand:+ start:4334 stop:5185 length:852 start_codon:yes stop_codon:yes gene_type:complete
MHVFTTKKTLTNFLSERINSSFSIGFVPTMGAIHAGHISLIKNSINQNNITVVSIFVNPTQFDDQIDLEKYPKDLVNDVKLISLKVDADIVIYAPEVMDLYEENVSIETFDFRGIELLMEGKSRPGHFNGVATVVNKLFNIVKPHRAYFGEKDFQQLQIIRKLVKVRKISTLIIACPTVRELNGLAISSRNNRLSKYQKTRASKVYQILHQVKQKFNDDSIINITKWVEEQFKMDTLFKLEYFNICDISTFEQAVNIDLTKSYRAFIAVYVADIRLIDNIALN